LTNDENNFLAAILSFRRIAWLKLLPTWLVQFLSGSSISPIKAERRFSTFCPGSKSYILK
jgi:hypothetical protein